MQILVLLHSWFAAIDCAGGHIVDEFVAPVGKPMLLTLHKQRDLGPLELAIDVAECPVPCCLASAAATPSA